MTPWQEVRALVEKANIERLDCNAEAHVRSDAHRYVSIYSNEVWHVASVMQTGVNSEDEAVARALAIVAAVNFIREHGATVAGLWEERERLQATLNNTLAERDAAEHVAQSSGISAIDAESRATRAEAALKEAGAERDVMRLKLVELAGCCAECDGDGWALVECDKDEDCEPEWQPCEACADIRAAIPTPPTVTVEAQR
jgi:hypothetical protein